VKPHIIATLKELHHNARKMNFSKGTTSRTERKIGENAMLPKQKPSQWYYFTSLAKEKRKVTWWRVGSKANLLYVCLWIIQRVDGDPIASYGLGEAYWLWGLGPPLLPLPASAQFCSSASKKTELGGSLRQYLWTILFKHCAPAAHPQVPAFWVLQVLFVTTFTDAFSTAQTTVRRKGG
jgi:hypothetical protein